MTSANNRTDTPPVKTEIRSARRTQVEGRFTERVRYRSSFSLSRKTLLKEVDATRHGDFSLSSGLFRVSVWEDNRVRAWPWVRAAERTGRGQREESGLVRGDPGDWGTRGDSVVSQQRELQASKMLPVSVTVSRQRCWLLAPTLKPEERPSLPGAQTLHQVGASRVPAESSRLDRVGVDSHLCRSAQKRVILMGRESRSGRSRSGQEVRDLSRLTHAAAGRDFWLHGTMPSSPS